MKRRKRSAGARPLKFGSRDDAFRYTKDEVKGPVVVEIVAPALGAGVYMVYPDGGAIRQMSESEVEDDQA